MNKITALTKNKLLCVLKFIGNHDKPIPISYIQCLYDKYGDTYDFGTDKCELIYENRFWCNGWKDKNGTFTNNFQKYKREFLDKKTNWNPDCEDCNPEDPGECRLCRER